MSLLICGSIATDHLMTFQGRFKDSLVVEQLDKISVSFLVEDLEIRRGGVAPNMCFGLGRLGLRPVLVGAAGEDFEDYRSWLDRHGVDTRFVHISEARHTARFICTTDSSMAQFASFYPGAMSEARLIELRPIVEKVGEPDHVLIAADDPEGMVRHTHECRQRGYPFIADPSQQLAFSDGALIRDLIDGATYLFSNEYESHMIESKTGWSAEEILQRVYLFSNEYESHMIESKTGWSAEEILQRVGTQVTTLGPDGVRITARDAEPVEVKAAAGVTAVEPTGVGDAFRAGFLAGLEWGFGHERSAQVGCVLAAYVVETVGTQEYSFTHAEFVERIRGSYGDAAADEVATRVR